jgi:predicted O-methyltransferase YrrM
MPKPDRLPQTLPSDWSSAIDEAWRRVRGTPGYLREREARFLALAALAAPRSGTILEIGSFKGRSTVGLAYIAKRYGLGSVVAVDPHTAPSATDPDLGGKHSTFEDFLDNLQRADVLDVVEPHRQYSGELAVTWDRPIGLLWIDGDHTYEGARTDLELFRRHLVPGAIVAMHDVLNVFDGSLRVFVEHVLGSDDFGPAGFCDSVGWAQFRPHDGARPAYRRRRQRLAAPARRLIPVLKRRKQEMGRPGRILGPVDRLLYRFWRALAPSGPVDPVRFMSAIAR